MVTNTPMLGFTTKTIEHNSITIMSWDLVGNEKIRPVWKHYYPGTHGKALILSYIYIVGGSALLNVCYAASILQNKPCAF